MGIYRVVFILYVYGMVAPNKSKYEKAKKALVKDVYDKESLRDVATYYFDSKDYEGVFKITKFMRDSIMNDDMYLYYLESLSYDYTGKIDKALDSIIKGWEVCRGSNWEIGRQYAWCLYRIGEYDKGLHISKKLWESTKNVSIAYVLAVGYGVTEDVKGLGMVVKWYYENKDKDEFNGKYMEERFMKFRRVYYEVSREGISIDESSKRHVD